MQQPIGELNNSLQMLTFKPVASWQRVANTKHDRAQAKVQKSPIYDWFKTVTHRTTSHPGTTSYPGTTTYRRHHFAALTKWSAPIAATRTWSPSSLASVETLSTTDATAKDLRCPRATLN